MNLSTFLPCPLPVEVAADLLRARYGIQGVLTPLPGERDQNFRVDSPDGRFVLKLHHPDEEPAAIRFQNDALQHIAARDPGLVVPGVCADLDGETIWAAEGRQGRLLTWVEGGPLYKQMPLAPVLQESLGAMLARLDRALADCTATPQAGRLLWDVQHLMELAPLLTHLPEDLRPLVLPALDRWEQNILPGLAALPRQIIHNDANHSNTLADAERVTGFIDFGDLAVAPRIQELAVACSYHAGEGPGGSLQVIGRVADAYSAVLPLTAAERRLLPGMVAGRRMMGLTIGHWRALVDPAEAPAILRGMKISAERLRDLLDTLPPSLILESP